MNPQYGESELDLFRDPYHCELRVYDFARGIFPPWEAPASPGETRRNVIFPHFHDAFEGILVTKGRLSLGVGGETRTLEVGDVALVTPFTPHSGSTELVEPLEFYCLGVSHGVISSAFPPINDTIGRFFEGRIALRSFIAAGEPPAERIRALIESIYVKNVDLKAKSDEIALSALGMSIFSELYELFACLLGECTAAEKPEKNAQNLEFTDTITRFIHEKYRLPISSSDAAAYLGYNNAYFCRLFRRNFGLTFTEYLNMYRIQMVCRHRFDDKNSLKTIAEAEGFEEYYIFLRNFKRFIGRNPSEFLQNREKKSK